MTRAPYEQRRDALIERLTSLVIGDGRLAAVWLQGSLADGTADAWSDVDAYVCVLDEHFDEVYAARSDLAAQLGSVLIAMDTPALHAVNCLMDGPVKLDLFFEMLSRVADVQRPAVRMLVDKAGVGPRLRTGWQPSREEALNLVDRYFRGTFQGGSWPLRLIERGQWATLVMTELMLVNDFLVAFMAAQTDPRHLFKNRFSTPRLLPSGQRDLVESLGEAIVSAAAARDRIAVRDVHLDIVAALIREGRAAYAALGGACPLTDAAEQSLLAFYVREWPAG